jgi:hypothetical protein
MTTIYDIINTIKTFLRANPIVNTVTFGDIADIDLNKTTIYPLTHFFINNVTVADQVIQVSMSMLFCDIVDYTKNFNDDDFGNRQDDTNIVDVYNTQLQIANALIQDLKRGDLYRDRYQLEGNAVLEPFNDRFENELAGWTVDLVINIANDGISVC